MLYISTEDLKSPAPSPLMTHRGYVLGDGTRLMSMDQDSFITRPNVRELSSCGQDVLRVTSVSHPWNDSPTFRHFTFSDTLPIPDFRSNSSGSTHSLMSSISPMSVRHALPSQDGNTKCGNVFSRNTITKDDSRSEITCPFIFVNQNTVVPKLPFCEEFDGVNMKKTSTISESIMALLATQHKESTINVLPLDPNELDVGYRSSVYFDRLREIYDIIESTTELGANSEVASTPVHLWSLPSLESLAPQLNPTPVEDEFESLTETTLEEPPPKKLSCAFADFNLDSESENVDVGSVDLKIRYLLEKETIRVTVIKAEDVFDPNKPERHINPFIKLSIYQQNKRKKRTSVVRKSKNPVFQEVFQLDDVVEKWLHVTCLLVQLYHKKRIGSRYLGGALIWLDDLDLMDKNEELVTEIFRTSLY